MTGTKPIVDLFIDANILLALAFALWWGARRIMARSAIRQDYTRQLRLMKLFLAVTILSPLVASLAARAGTALAPETPLTVSDIAVAAFLRGDIAMPAVRFEALLNLRDATVDRFLAGQSAWLTILAAALTFGALVHAVRLAATIWRIRAALGRSYLWRRTARVDIRVSDRVGAPFAVRGLRRRHVVVPSAMLTRPHELKIVLAHEFQHLRGGDTEWEIVFELLRPILYWNPAFAALKRQFEHLRELGCDQQVLDRGNVAAADYVRCLLDHCERRLREPLPRAMNVAFVKAGTSRLALEDRVMAMLDPAPTRHGRLALPVLALLLASGVSVAALSVRQPGDWSHDRLMLSTVVNLERIHAINGRY